ncbi:MAG: hypothetical protein J6V72_04985 [Kiritimatiellae bacterium]|nr:hypothetical protein [Kiritimatiellia bacterium]
MTLAYDLEHLRVLCDAVISASAELAKHAEIPDWLAHRVCHLSCEAQDFALAVCGYQTETKGDAK